MYTWLELLGRRSAALVSCWARANMANYKVPRSVVFMDELPMNAGGKVDKAALIKRSVQARP